MFETKNIFNAGWSHGKYFDYWSFVHFLTGVILGIGVIIFSLNHFVSLVVIFILLSLYEVMEILARVSEDFENILLDIVVGSIGSMVAIFLLPQIVSKQNILSILSLCIIVNLLCVSRGWKNYLKRKASQSDSYKYILYTLYAVYVLGILVAAVSFFYWLR